MPYFKSEYANGSIIRPHAYRQKVKRKPWYYQAVMPPEWPSQVELPKPYTEASSYFTGIKYNKIDLPKPPEVEPPKPPSTLADYNDPKQINSFRDIILGSFNPHMNHSKMFGEFMAKTPGLNIIPNTLQVFKDFYLKPVINSEHSKVFGMNINHAMLNLLTGLSEDLDVLARPIKRPIIEMSKKPSKENLTNIVRTAGVLVNPGTLVLPKTQKYIRESFIGNEEGIKNYDYNTGNIAKDIALEFASDPLTYATWGGSTAIKSTLKETGKIANAAFKKASKEYLAKITADAAVKQAVKESSEIAFKEAITKTNYFSKSSQLTRSIIFDQAEDVALEAAQKKFTKVYTKNLLEHLDAPSVVTTLASTNKFFKGLVKTQSDLILKNMSTSVIGSLGKDLRKADDTISKFLFKAALTPPGVYPLYKAFFSTPIKSFFHNQILQKTRQVTVNRFLNNSESFLKAGTYDGVSQVIQKELKVNGLLEELEAISEATDPQQAAYYIAEKVGSLLEPIKSLLKNPDVPADIKYREVLNSLQSIDSYNKIESVEDFIDILKRLDDTYKQLDGSELAESGFQQYIDEYIAIKKSLTALKNAEKAQKELDKIIMPTIQGILEIQHSKILDKYSIKDILRAFSNQVLQKPTPQILKQIKQLQNLFTKIATKQLSPAQEQIIIKQIQEIANTLKNNIENINSEDLYKPLLKTLNKLINNVSTPKTHHIRMQAYDDLAQLTKQLETINTSKNLKDINPELLEIFMIYDANTKQASPNIDLIQKLKLLTNSSDFRNTDKIQFKDTKLYKWAVRTEKRYNKLQDIANKGNTYVTKINEGYTVTSFRSALRRARDIMYNRDSIVKQYLKLNKGIKEITNYAKTMLQNSRSPLSDKNINKVFKIIHDLRDVAEYTDKTGSNYNYPDMFDDLQEAIKQYKLLLESILNPNIPFESVYRSLKDSHTNLVRALNRVEETVGAKNVWRTENIAKDSYELSGINKAVTRSSDPFPKVINTKVEEALDDFLKMFPGHLTINSKEFLESDAYQKLFFKYRNYIENSIRQVLINSVRWDYEVANNYKTKGRRLKRYISEKLKPTLISFTKDLIKKAPKEFKEKLKNDIEFKKEFNKAFDRFAKSLEDTLNSHTERRQYLTNHAVARNSIAGTERPFKDFMNMLNLLNDTLNKVDFDYIEKNQIDIQYDRTLDTLQLDKIQVQMALNSIPGIQKLFDHPQISAILTNIINQEHPTVSPFFKDLSEDGKQTYAVLAMKAQGILNFNRLVNELDAWWESLPASERPANVDARNAVLTTLAYLAKKDIWDMDSQEILNTIIENSQNYINGANPVGQRHNVDILMQQYDITPAMVLEELDGITDTKRHNALYDTVAQIKIWEAIHKETYTGTMLDIETTGLIDGASKTPRGNITEIALVGRNEEGKIEIIFNKKIQLDPDTITEQYMVNPNYLKQLEIGLEPEELAKLEKEAASKNLTVFQLMERQYIDNLTSTGEMYDEARLLSEFYQVLLSRPDYETLRTFNGDEFDLIYLDKKMSKYHIGDNITPSDFWRKIHNVTIKGEIPRRTPTFSDLMNYKFIKEDMYRELTKDKYIFSDTVVHQLSGILDHYVTAQRNLDKFSKFTARTPQLIEGVDGEFEEFLRNLIDVDEILHPKLGSETLDQIESRLDYDATIPLNFEDSTIASELAEAIQLKKAQGGFIDIFKKDLRLDNELKEICQEIYLEMAEVLSNVKAINGAGRNIPIPEKMYDVYSPKYDAAALADLLYAMGQHSELPGKVRITNMTQLITMGLSGKPIIAYRKVPGTTWADLDMTGVVLTPQLHQTLSKFQRSIIKAQKSLWNAQTLHVYKDDIYNMLQDIKDSNIIIEATVVKTDSLNLQFTYATLECIWKRIVARSNIGQDTRFLATKLIKELTKKYPDLVEFIDDGSAHFKPLMNSNVMRYQYPDYMKTQKHIEYSQSSCVANTQKDMMNRFRDLQDEVEIEVSRGKAQEIDTAGNLLEEANAIKLNSYKHGNPTKLTRALERIGQAFNRTFAAWTTNQFMKLNPIQIRNYIINSGHAHSVTLKKPSGKFFNNSSVFGEFLLKKSELTDLGVTWNWDEKTQRLTLGLEEDLISRLKLNSNEITRINHIENDELVLGYRYLLDGEPIRPIILEEIPYEVLRQYVAGHDRYIEVIWELRQRLLRMNPELSGHLGLLNMDEDYIKTTDNPLFPKFGKNKNKATEDDLSYFNTWNLGDFEAIQEIKSDINVDYLDIINLLSNKMINHIYKHIEYGEFVKTGGFSLNNSMISDMSYSEVKEMLKNNRDLTVVYLADNKHAIGGFELRRIDIVSESNFKKAKELNATILPWDTYELALRNINQFSYSNKAMAIWNKVIQSYKHSWLPALGTAFRNIIDSTIKNYAEGNSVPETTMNYFKSFDLLYKYDQAAREIKKLDPWGRYRLDNAELYFDTPNPKLDRDTYHFIYDFLQNNGANAISTEIDGIFGVLMNPNSVVERVARLTQYLNLKDQGLAYSEIIRRISETHFNYDAKSYKDFLAQQYIPFYTYVSNNIHYLVHLVEENPSFLRKFFQFYRPIWDFDSINHDELEKNLSLQYQILTGNLPLKMFGYNDKPITIEKMITVESKHKFGETIAYNPETKMYKNKVPVKETVTNTAVLKMGSSILDALQFFTNPIHNIKEKLAPPLQSLIDSVTEFSNTAIGNRQATGWVDYNTNEALYNHDFMSTSVQNMFRDPSKLMTLVPGIAGLIPNSVARDVVAIGSGIAARKMQSKVTERTDNKALGTLPSVFGATKRWGDGLEFLNKFENKNYPLSYDYPAKHRGGYSKGGYSKGYKPKTYPRPSYARSKYASKKFYANKFYAATPRPGQGVTYRTRPNGRYSTYYTGYPARSYVTGKRPSSKYANFLYNIRHPNFGHNKPSSLHNTNMQTIPQYLYSYMGKNRQGKSKILSWMRMDTPYKVKSTLRRLTRP